VQHVEVRRLPRHHHLDCRIGTQPVSVAVAERLRELGDRVTVPTTLNAISMGRRRWRALGIPPKRAVEVERQTDAYLARWAQPSFTCAPHLLGASRGSGEPVGSAESSALAFANSMPGARPRKHPDYLDLGMGLNGRAPLSGCHLDANRPGPLPDDRSGEPSDLQGVEPRPGPLRHPGDAQGAALGLPPLTGSRR
jgi:predicted aconitase